MAERPAIMLAIMEPPPGMEEEFNDWYDTEHLPQRRGLPGFLQANRWVCTEGFPRSLATYDLSSLAALSHPAYLAVSGPNSTPWSRRVLARTARAGRLRVEAERITPGASLSLPVAEVSRLLVAQYVPAAPSFASDAMEAFAALPRLAQARLFSSANGPDMWAVAEFSGPVHTSVLMGAMGDIGGVGATFFNIYVPYSSSSS